MLVKIGVIIISQGYALYRLFVFVNSDRLLVDNWITHRLVLLLNSKVMVKEAYHERQSIAFHSE
jgi:hypothetical protein